MQTILIVSQSKDTQEIEVNKILEPFSLASVDITRITPENTIGIGSVREIKRKVGLKPYQSQIKAVIIEDAQTLTVEAQNALLKTLEEPPNHTIIALLADNIDALLPTVVSRCKVIQPITTNNLQLTDKELEVSSQQLEAVSGPIGNRLKLAQHATKDKEAAILWLKTMILATRQKLLKEIIGHSNDTYHHSAKNHLVSRYLTILISLQNAYTLLTTTNVNPRFTLETLFLSIDDSSIMEK